MSTLGHDEVYIEYVCSCNQEITGSVVVGSLESMTYNECSRCNYPLPDLETPFIYCSMCKEVDAEAKIVCRVEHHIQSFECPQCKGKVPVDALREFWDNLIRESQEQVQDCLNVDQVELEDPSGGLLVCLTFHNITSLLVEGTLVTHCTNCDQLYDMAKEDESLQTVAVQMVRLCQCPALSVDQLERMQVVEEKDHLHIRCPRCYTTVRSPNTPPFRSIFSREWGVSTGRAEVQRIENLQVGDHIYFQRKLYEHHAIVTGVDIPEGSFTTIHYSEGPDAKSSGPHKATVLEATIRLVEETDPIYVVLYPPLDCLPFYLVVGKARSKLGETAYNLITSNCEHLARWCKIGEKSSKQVERAVSQVSAAVREGARAAALRATLRRMPGLLGRAAGSVVNGLTLAAEICTARRDMTAGRLTKVQFRERLMRSLLVNGVLIGATMTGAGAGTTMVVGALAGLVIGGGRGRTEQAVGATQRPALPPTPGSAEGDCEEKEVATRV